MNVTLSPTPELWNAPLNGTQVPVRVWHGHTQAGTPIEAFVVSITPRDPADHAALAQQVPPYMRPSREVYDIDTPKRG